MDEGPGIGPELLPLLVSTSSLRAWPGNARLSDVDSLADSLRVNGQYRPLLFQRSTGYVIAGNHTLQAARRLGWSQVAAVGLDLDDAQAARIVLVDNRTADLGTTEQLLVLQLLQETGLPGTGYDEAALAQLLRLVDAPDWPTFDETAADDVPMLDCPSCSLRFPA